MADWFQLASVLVALSWYLTVVGLNITGYLLLFQQFLLAPRNRDRPEHSERALPHVTIIRPCKGHDPYLEQCLAATFLQDYPLGKTTIFFCVHSRHDRSLPPLQKLCHQYPRHRTRIFIEEEAGADRPTDTLGPNPKVRNMSRAYRAASSDLIWILDCNVWVREGACRRMVDKLEGNCSTASRPYNLVYHLPIYLNVHNAMFCPADGEWKSLPRTSEHSNRPPFGGLMEELFSSTVFAKMYTAVNFWAIGPCVTGKSTMFRRSDLDKRACGLHTAGAPDRTLSCDHTGLDTFSDVLCEDQAIADFLWFPRVQAKRTRHRHGLMRGELAIQPVKLTLAEYISRHVRWVRARKFAFWPGTVLEPATESVFCSCLAALTFAPYYCEAVQQQGTCQWRVFALFSTTSLAVWAAMDFGLFLLIRTAHQRKQRTGEEAVNSAQLRQAYTPPTLLSWLAAWLSRELLALPIWLFAFFGGNTVLWRGHRYYLCLDGRMEHSETS